MSPVESAYLLDSDFLLRWQLDLFSLDFHCVVVRPNPGTIGLGVHLCEFRAKEENLRGIKDPQQQRYQ